MVQTGRKIHRSKKRKKIKVREKVEAGKIT